MQRPDTLPAQLFLLAVDPARRRLTGRSELGYVLRAAALVDLQLTGHLADDGGRPKAAGNPEPPDPALDPVLRQVTAEPGRRWSYWVRKDARRAISMVRDQLVAGRRIELCVDGPVHRADDSLSRAGDRFAFRAHPYSSVFIRILPWLIVASHRQP